jgi:TATA-box binding protein (TBP) (component of TFIID and TFIIIB)
MSVNLTNIKVSINIISQSLDSVENCMKELTRIYKRYNNFIVIREEFVYTIFRPGKKSSNHINITKIKNFDEIEKAVKKLDVFKFKVNENSLKIDNITGSIDLKKEINIQKVINIVTKEEKFNNIKVSYNNEKFPGLFLKVKAVGTIIVFYSGKVVFVGCKTLSNLECLASLTRVLMEMN